MNLVNSYPMKKFYLPIFVAASMTFALTSCNKEIDSPAQNNEENLVTVSITAGNPEIDPATKTEMVGTTPYWSAEDAIGVSTQNENSYNNVKFLSGLTEKAATATFTAEVAASNLGKTAYAYYPYSTNNPYATGVIGVDIPETQYPSLTSFDSKADLMVTNEPFELAASLSDLIFKRLGAILKVVIIDNTTGKVLNGQSVSDVKLTVDSDIIGRAKIDLVNAQLDGFSSGAKKSVQAVYTNEKYTINGSNATYLIVYPQVLEAGGSLTLEGTTDNYKFSKTISSIPELNFKGGAITTLKIKVDSFTADPAGAALPFTENFSAITVGNNTSSSGSSTKTDSDELTQFQTVANAYKAGGAVRLGKSGTLTTNALNLSNDFTVVVKIKGWSTSEKDLTVTVGDQSHTFSCTTAMTDEFNEFSHKFSAATKKSSVSFTTDANTRVFIDNIKIVSGDYVVVPVINYESPDIVPAAGKEIEIPFSIDNPTEGKTLSVSIKNGSEGMISSASVDAENNIIKATISAYNGTDINRKGYLVLNYDNAENDGLEIEIEQQKASNTDIITYAKVSVTGSSYSDWSDKTFGSSAVYSGRTAGSNSGIQMNSPANTGFYTTTSGGYVKSISIADWKSQSNSAGKFVVYASNTAYTGFTNNDETQVIELTSSNLSYTFTDNYKFIKVTGSGKAIYVDQITVEWSSEAIPVPVEKPVISFDSSTNKVTITCATEGADIYYTTNNNDPTSSDTKYTSPIQLSSGDAFTIKAIATKSGMLDSEIASEDVAYYSGSTGEKKDIITANMLTATGTSYAAFSEVKYEGTGHSDAVYAGASALNSETNIQLRSKSSDSGIFTTTSGGKVKSIKINVASGSNTIDVYGKNSAYSLVGDLYSTDTQGTKIGSVSETGTITVEGDYEYIGIRSNNGAVYISSIEITWD